MSSLSGGLLPMKGVSSPTSALDNMAPLAPLSSKSTMSNKDEFSDMFDDLLDAPVPTKVKKSKSKSKSKKSSKSSSKKSSKSSSGYDYGDTPLSPNLGNSMDDINFDPPPTNTFSAPSNVNADDLDDSILGGLFGGGTSKPKGIKKSAPDVEDSRPKSMSHASSRGGSGNDSYKGYDETNEQPRSTSPEVKVSRPSTTGSRRPRNQGGMSSGFGGGHNDDDLFNFNPKPTTAPSYSTTTASGQNDSPKDDFDDSFEIPDLDDTNATRANPTADASKTSMATEQSEINRPSTTVGRRSHSMWGGSDGADKTKNSDHTSTSSAYAPSGGRPRTTSGSSLRYGSDFTDTSVVDSHPQPPNSDVNNQEDSLDMDFDIDSLLPDSTSANKPSSDSSQLNSNIQRNTSSSSSMSSGAHMPHLPTAPHSSKSRSPSPSKTHNTATSSNPPSGESPSSSPLLGGQTKKKINDTDDVDIGFMPSFLESGREPRSRRQVGRSQSARGRLGGKSPFTPSTVPDDDDDSMDALDMALGIGGDNAKAGSGRMANKVKDPFAQPEKKASYKPPSSSTASGGDQGDDSAIGGGIGGRSRRTSRSTSPTKENSVKATTDSQSSGGYTNLPLLGSPRVTNNNAHGSDNNTQTPTKNKDKSKEKSTKDVLKNNKNIGNGLTVTVDVPSDKPLSNPPTVTVITPGGGHQKNHTFSPDPAPNDHLDDSIGSITNAPAAKPELYTSSNQHSVTFTKKLTSTSPTNHATATAGGNGNGGGGSAKKILKKSAPEFQSPSLSRSSSYNKDDPPQDGSSSGGGVGGSSQRRPRRNSYDAAGDDEDVFSMSMSSLPSTSPSVGKRNKPSWLTASGASGLNLDSSIDSSNLHAMTMNPISSNPSVRMLQQKLDEVTIQKETIEKYLRAEIEMLKIKVATLPNSADSTGVDHSVDFQNLKIKANNLAEENARLKEEAVVEKIRHQKELTHLRDKHTADMEYGNASRAEELEMADRRHKETIQSLKKLHMDELMAVKQRAKDGLALEQLSSQITTTTGSLKLIEEQMSLQYRGVDAVREGQFEARERLLQDMEAQAREKAEAAEMENFKVKGLLSHMDQVVANLRNQGGEERERLRLEHRRLEAMQTSLDSERRVMHERFSAEMDQVKRKLAAAEEANQKEQAARSEQMAEIADMRRKLEAEKKEFSVYVSTNVKSAERSTQHLKEEEARLLELRAEINQEQAVLNQKKRDAEDQLNQASSWNNTVQQAKHDLQRERESLEDLAMELQEMSDILVDRDSKFSMREQDILAREEHISSEKEAIDAAYGILQAKEKELSQFHLHADQQRMAMKQLEDEMLERRVVVSARQRELSKLQNEETSQRLQIALSSVHSVSRVGAKNGTNNSKMSSDARNLRNDGREKENFQQPDDRGGQSFVNSKVSPISKTRGNFNFEEQIASARQTMQLARGGVARISHTNTERNEFLRDETSFLSKIQPKRI